MLPKKRNLRLGIPSKGRMAELTLELLNVRPAAVRVPQPPRRTLRWACRAQLPEALPAAVTAEPARGAPALRSAMRRTASSP